MAKRAGPFTMTPSDWVVMITPPGLIQVWSFLWSHADRKTRLCWPSHIRIQAVTGLAKATIVRVLGWLTEHGYCAKVKTGGGRSSSVYKILWSKAVPALRFQRALDEADEVKAQLLQSQLSQGETAAVSGRRFKLSQGETQSRCSGVEIVPTEPVPGSCGPDQRAFFAAFANKLSATRTEQRHGA